MLIDFAKRRILFVYFLCKVLERGKERRRGRGGVVLNLNQNNLKLGKGGNSKRQVKKRATRRVI